MIRINKNDLKVAFTKRDLIYRTGKTNEDSRKYFLVIAYLRKHITQVDCINCTINDIVDQCGYKQNRHSNGVNIEIYEILQQLITDKKIKYDGDLAAIKNNEFIRFTVPDRNNLFYVSKDKEFVILTVGEFDKIVQNKTKSNKAILVVIYLYIKQFINADKESKLGRVAYPSKYGMRQKLKIASKTTIENAVKDLVDLHMIYEHVSGYYQDQDGFYIPCNNAYAFNESDLENISENMANYYHVDKLYSLSELKQLAGFNESLIKFPKRQKS